MGIWVVGFEECVEVADFRFDGGVMGWGVGDPLDVCFGLLHGFAGGWDFVCSVDFGDEVCGWVFGEGCCFDGVGDFEEAD